MLASSFLDPVLGLDVHFEMVPTPAPVPTPIPNPFIGLVFDPVGLACGLALGAAIGAVMGAPFQGPVLYWTAFPATNTGTEAKGVPGHILIPPGVAWAPFPKTPKPVIHPGETPKPALPIKPEDDAVVVFGSKTVTVMGSNAVRLGDIALSCSEPLRLPSSVVLAVPKGAPILIGGPPSLDIMAAVLASLRTRFVSDSLHALLSRLKPSRFRNLLKRVVCFFTGHPVDVASGKVMTEFVDTELPGPLPLKIERIYSSAFASRPGPVGHGWSLSLNQTIWRERGKVVLLAEDGREVEFDTFDFPGHRIAAGQSVYNPIDRLTLHCDPGETWRVIDHEGTTRQFAAVPGGRVGVAVLIRTRSRCGSHEIGYLYDERGLLAWVRDSGGRMIGLVHDARGRLTELHRPNPQSEGFYCHRRYVYDGEGDLVEVVDALGKRWRFAYVGHLLTQETDRNGLSFYFAYDGLGEDAWCVRTWGDGGIHDHVLGYDKHKHVTWVTNSLGYTTQYHMNVAGLVVKVVDPLGGATLYEYDPITLASTKVVDPLGAESVRRHDERGNLVTVIAADGGVTSTTYAGYERVSLRDARGGEWSWRHAPNGCLLETTSPAGRRTRRQWNDGLLVAFERGPAQKTTLHYDEHKQVRALGLANGTYEQYQHDRLGRLVAIRHPSGGVSQFIHDLEDRVIVARNATGDEQRLVYTPEGDVVEVRDGLRELKVGYTQYRRVASREQAGSQQRFEYDTEGRLCVVVNEAGERFTALHDVAGRIAKEVGFDGRSWTFVHDATGREVEVHTPSGRVRKSRYDAVGRVLEHSHADGSFTRLTYDAAGQLSAAQNQHARVELERDADGLICAERCKGNEVRSAYDEVGERVELSTSLGARMLISRNALGEPQRLYLGRDADHRQSADVGLAHTPLGALKSLYFANGVEVAWQHDVAGRPTARTLALRRGGEVEQRERIDYGWRGEDQLTSMATLGQATRSFDHDARGNVIRERIDDTTLARAIDAVGNVYRSETGEDRRYGSGGRLEQVAGQRVEHDEDGNQTLRAASQGDWRYHWNDHGLLAAIERPDGARVDFEYDAFARRIGRRILAPDGAVERETTFVWDGHTVVNEVDGSDGLTTWHWLPDKPTPIIKERAGRRWTIASDHLGTPTQMYDETGAAAWAATIDVFGQARIELGEARDCPWRWPGQYDDGFQDELYNRCRYYSPALGRFISQDPAGLYAGLNRYAYVGDPTTWIDLLGLTGTYMFTFKSGEMYVGKGPHDRALVSQSVRTTQVGPGATITQGAHMDFGSDKMGLMVEAELMARNNFGTNANMLNAINSPGRDLLANATAAEKALVKANADALEQAHAKSTGKIC